MNKQPHGLLTLVLAGVLGSTGLTIAGAQYAQRQAVTMTETIFHGEKSSVSSVFLTQQATIDNRLIWTTTTPLGDVTQASTQLEASRSQLYAPNTWDLELEVMYAGNQSSSTTGSFDLSTDFDSGYPLEMLQDVASRVPPGETYTETVRVADYGAYYTPSVRLRLPYEGDCLWYGRTSDYDNPLSDYFRKPVAPEDFATVTMTADANGTIFDITTELMSQDNTKDEIAAVLIDTTVYGAQNSPDGVVIHRLDFEVEEEYGEVTLRQAQVAFTMEDATCAGSWLSLRDEHLFLLTGAESVDTITILDASTMDIVQTISVPNLGVTAITQYDDFFVLESYEGDFALYTPDETGYTLTMTGNYAHYIETDYKGGFTTTMAYEEGKLITAMRTGYYGDSMALQAYVAVNTQEGCIFSAMYTPSLAQHGEDTYRLMPRPWDGVMPEVTLG